MIFCRIALALQFIFIHSLPASAGVVPFGFFRTQQSVPYTTKVLGGNNAIGGVAAANRVALDASGNVYVTGTFNNSSTNSRPTSDFSNTNVLGAQTTTGSDIFVAKLNSSGVQQWIKVLGGTQNELAGGVAVDSSGNVFVGGTFFNSSADDRVVKDFSGAQLLGFNSTAGQDAFLAKLDSSGTQVWIKKMGGNGTDNVMGVSTDSSGNVYAIGIATGGTTNTYNVVDFAGTALPLICPSCSGPAAVLAKLNTSGTQQWVKKAGSANNSGGFDIFINSADEIFVTGLFYNNTTNGNSGLDFSGAALPGRHTSTGNNIFVAKLTTSGTQTWINKAGSSDTTGSTSFNFGVSADSSGNAYVICDFMNDTSDTRGFKDFSNAQVLGLGASAFGDVLLAKLNSADGTMAWKKTMGSSAYRDQGLGVAVDSSGNVYATGVYTGAGTDFSSAAITSTSSNQNNGFLAKLNSSGTQQWIKKVTGNTAARGHGVAVNATAIYAAGQFTNNTANASLVTGYDTSSLLGKGTAAAQSAFLVILPNP